MDKTLNPMKEDKPRVLVVDDNSVFLDIMDRELDAYEVSTTSTGQEALDRINDEIDVVLLDRRLPDISGDEVLQRIREQDFSCQVMMITAVDPDFDIFELPCDDYLVKPILPETVETTIESLLTRATFNEKIREQFVLTKKLVTLEATKTDSELAESDEYTAAKERLADLSAELNHLITQSVDRNIVACLYREINADTGEFSAQMERVV